MQCLSQFAKKGTALCGIRSCKRRHGSEASASGDGIGECGGCASEARSLAFKAMDMSEGAGKVLQTQSRPT